MVDCNIFATNRQASFSEEPRTYAASRRMAAGARGASFETRRSLSSGRRSRTRWTPLFGMRAACSLPHPHPVMADAPLAAVGVAEQAGGGEEEPAPAAHP